jgi:hypothetical protein
MQIHSSRLLVDVTLSLYQNHDASIAPATHSRLSQLALALIENRIPFSDCVESSLSLTGTSQPIEKLHEILSIPSDPIRSDDSDAADDSQLRKKTRPWSPYEDSRLVAGIYRYGVDNWTSIAHFVGNGRTRSQCSQRWQRSLDPRLSRDHWTRTEELCLVQLVQYYGDKSWTQVASRLGNRSDVQCRYRYKMIQKEGRVPMPGIRKAQSGQIPVGQFVMPRPMPTFVPLVLAQPAGQLRPSHSVPVALALNPQKPPEAPPPEKPEERRASSAEHEETALVFELFRDEDPDDIPIWY